MNYESVTRVMLEVLPELADAYAAEEQRSAKEGGQPTQYGVFWFVLEPFLNELLASDKDPALLQRVFDFFEEMARSLDIQVVNLMQVEILESLVGKPSRLRAAWEYMGEETRKLARETAQTYGCEANLPREKSRGGYFLSWLTQKLKRKTN